MPTQAEIQAHREAIATLVALAQDDLIDGLRGVDLQNPRQVAAVVREVFPALAEVYVPAVSAVAADWYDGLREDAAVAAVFTASVLAAPSVDDLQDLIGDMLTPLFIDGEADTLTTVKALAETLVSATDQQTVEANTAQDRAVIGYARHASANACTFCQLLATRGTDKLYASEWSALRVVTKRAKRKQGEKYHDWCRCTPVPVWSKADYEEAPYVAEWRQAYKDATKATRGAEKPTQAILAHMRESLGNRH